MNSPGAGKSDLATRVVSAIVLAPVVLAALWFGGAPFALLALLAAILVLWEWTGMALGDRRSAVNVIGWGTLLLVSGLTYFGAPAYALLISVAGALVSGVVAGSQWKWSSSGVLYAALPLIAFVSLRGSPEGLAAMVLIIGIVWATDIFAYFSGRSIGGPKIWPAVSPKKTWAGLIGGTIAACIFAALFARAADYAPLPLATLALVLAIFSQAGDFMESAVKRRFGVKDASNLIPGHGGVMDRIDGLGPAAVLAAAVGFLHVGDPASGLLVW
ncbi:MAG: phosphatidate cytidylyltransferase [Rhodobiaceae bacterium]|nr:phosphatidate cytidylyltransferase [Rhodobiaceae bacterium]MCC0057499.1 phosphatidate cytidylyltransferase [Rhodobiaceae bacterium]